MTDVSIPALTPRAGLTRQERLGYARRLVVLPVAMFSGLAVLWLGMVLLTLAAPAPVSFVLSPICGVLIGLLFIVGHDACHDSFTAFSWLNQTIGRLAFLPSLHSFSLWDLGHNRTHHRYNNVRGCDPVWAPLSPDDYRGLGPVRSMLYRFYRAPAGVFFYYMIELWAPYLTCSLPEIYRNMRPIYVIDTTLVLVFLTAQVWIVTAVGGIFGHGVLVSLLVGVIIPFLVWNGLMSMIIFLHHTHPAVRWYPSVPAWRADRGNINGSLHVRFPGPIGAMVLSIMEHNAHHLAPGVPLYNLPRMQRAMVANEDILSWRFSWRAFVRICKRCKLYDYDQGRWVTFNEAESRPVLADRPVRGAKLSA
jgi:acyl-lipid omega-6 desaturase (Delta-12 desaturase)